ncbi:hypothetical protein JQN72_07435 [Phycicoccus sp. CSK15P-2]|uniref:hypothetical protein n=1 Tax=Phycicoccus sp. CSK15P-2 TaxID=2807627 RepID=UPI001951C18E|nr:hypothetical protein [Phycicoccus sp. CSK15P-2]MBM6404073.1 hypothetical protein [Phycicoccus sp. CSK15P-2]
MTSLGATTLLQSRTEEERREDFRASLPSWTVAAAGAWACALTAALIGLAQLAGLVAQVVLDGESASLTTLTGPGALTTPRGELVATWTALAGAASTRPALDGWVTAYAVVDVVFALLYGLAAVLLLGRRALAVADGRGWTVAAVVLVALGAGADLAGSGLLLGLAGGDPDLLVTASRATWLCLALAALAAVVGRRQARDLLRGPDHPTPYEPGEPATPPGVGRQVLSGLYTHRFSLLVVVPFAALGLASGADILDQMPDVHRRWADGAAGARLTMAGTLTAVVMMVVAVVGRLRSHYVAMQVLPDAAPYRRPALLPWFVTGAALLVGAGVSVLVVEDADVILARLAVSVLVPWVLWLGSVLLRWAGGGVLWSRYLRPATRESARTVRVVGDVVAVLVLAIPALGLVRSFAAPVALGERGWSLACLLVGLLGALVVWPAALLVGQALARFAHPALLVALTPGAELDPAARGRARAVGWALLVGGVSLFVALGLRPRSFVTHLGVIEVVLLAVTAVAVPLGATVLLLQGGGAPDLLSRPGTPVLRTAPVMTLVVATAAGIGLTGSDARVHGLRTLAEAPPGSRTVADRPGLDDRARGLLADPTCGAPLPGTPHRVRPLFLLAAEGGGIRAAAWTALGTDALHEAGGPCGEALMSSGASGGAVGLTVTAATDDGAAFEAVRRMAGPDALGVAMAGLLVRDPVRSVAGVPFPADEPGWVDRAGLVEREWERAVTGLDRPFLDVGTGRVTGALVLNSTSVATRCRTLLSQAALDPDAVPRDCRTPTSPPGSVDLLPTLRSGCTGPPPTLRASTVALLASRFPYVTPSGVVTSGCAPGEPDPDAQQIVDGGYADNDGIGTVVDLASRWLPVVRAHNAAVLAGSGDALVLPVVLYLDNGSGSDLRVEAPGARNEALVPLVTQGAARAALSSTDAQLHRVAATLGTDQVVPGCGTGPESEPPEVCAALDTWRGPVAKVFFQPTRPSIAAPLGWVLSQQSLDGLTCARDDQVARSGVPPVSEVECGAEPVVDTSPDVLPRDGGSSGCGDRSRRDASPLAVRGYGTMLSALCLAREARTGG